MRYFLTLCLLLITTATLLVRPVLAQEMMIQEENPIVTRLEASCDEVKTTLRRIHTNDALTRVNMGQVYSATSAQLMARLNSRLALNSINSTELVDISGRFDTQRLEFSQAYKEYEASLSSLIKIDCKQRPAEFYALLLTTREARFKVLEVIQSASGMIADYQVGVERLQQSLKQSDAESEPSKDEN